MSATLLEEICDIRRSFDPSIKPSMKIDNDLISRFVSQIPIEHGGAADCGVANWRDNVWSNDRWRDSHRNK